MDERTRICLCIPMYGGVSAEWVKSLLQLIFGIQSDPSLDLDILYDDSQPLSRARNNMLSIAASKSPRPHFLLWLDSDNLLEYGGLKQLLSDGCDMVSALYFMRQAPHRPVILRNAEGAQVKKWAAEYPRNSLFQADAIGFGCCLMKWEVADRMLSAHEFPFDYLKVKGVDGKPACLSEDVVFCDRAREQGFGISVDSRVISGHVGGVVGAPGQKA